jgi:hypothetical protein
MERCPKLRARFIQIYLLLIICLVVVMCSSCSPRTSAALPIGQPLLIDGGRVWIQFENVGGKPHAMSGEWFYFPGSLIPGMITDFEAELILFNKKTNEIIRYNPIHGSDQDDANGFSDHRPTIDALPMHPSHQEVPKRKKKGDR